MRLKCLATIAGLYWKTADVTLSQEHPKLLQTRDGLFPKYIFFFYNQSLYIFISLLYPCTMIPCFCCQMLSSLTHINCCFCGKFRSLFFRLFYRFPLFCPTHPSPLQTKTGKCKSHAYSYSDILKGNVAETENGKTSSQPFR